MFLMVSAKGESDQPNFSERVLQQDKRQARRLPTGGHDRCVVRLGVRLLDLALNESADDVFNDYESDSWSMFRQ